MDIEDMPVYRDALRLVEIAEKEAARVQGRRPDIADHLRRSSSSVLFNLREGATEFSPREKARIYRVSQREAGECAGAFDALRVLHLDSPETEAGYHVSRRIIDQLTGLCKAALRRAITEDQRPR